MATIDNLDFDVKVLDGKYTVRVYMSGRMDILRYGEPWKENDTDRVTLALASELYETRRMSIPELMRKSYDNSEKHGFWDEQKEVTGTKFMLMVCELAEAFEEYRDNRPYTEVYFNDAKPDKPEGIPIEMADAVIRAFDFCERHKIDLLTAILQKMVYNATRPHLHGGKRA